MSEVPTRLDFSPPPKAEVLSADVPKPVGLAEMAKVLRAARSDVDPRVFEVSAEGAVKAHGFTPDEVKQLLKHYRDHMFALGRGMQQFQAGTDAADYTPGGYS
jgi:hypothetical protein